MQKEIEKLMKNLGVSAQEANEILEMDKEIDRGADPFPLTPEQKKVAKSMSQADRKPTVYKFTKRERKANTVKEEIISQLFTFICQNVSSDVVVTNKERQLSFTNNGETFELTLVQKRKKKEN